MFIAGLLLGGIIGMGLTCCVVMGGRYEDDSGTSNGHNISGQTDQRDDS